MGFSSLTGGGSDNNFGYNYPGTVNTPTPTSNGSGGGDLSMFNTGSSMGGSVDQTINNAGSLTDSSGGLSPTVGGSYSPTGGINWGSLLSGAASGLGTLATNGAPTAAILGATALAANKVGAESSTYANDYENLAAPAGSVASTFQTQAQTGKLQPWQQASIDQMVQQQRAQGNQFLANSGQGNSQGNVNSTTGLGINQQIDTNALVQQGQFQQQAFTDWSSSFGQYSDLMSKSIQAQITGDQEVMNLWSSVLGGLAKATQAGTTINNGTGGGSSGGGGGGGGGIGGLISGAISGIGSIFGF